MDLQRAALYVGQLDLGLRPLGCYLAFCRLFSSQSLGGRGMLRLSTQLVFICRPPMDCLNPLLNPLIQSPEEVSAIRGLMDATAPLQVEDYFR